MSRHFSKQSRSRPYSLNQYRERQNKFHILTLCESYLTLVCTGMRNFSKLWTVGVNISSKLMSLFAIFGVMTLLLIYSIEIYNCFKIIIQLSSRVVWWRPCFNQSGCFGSKKHNIRQNIRQFVVWI